MAGTKIFVRFSQVSPLEHARFKKVLLYIEFSKKSVMMYSFRFTNINISRENYVIIITMIYDLLQP